MTLFHWMAIGLACLYGAVSALGGMHQSRHRTIPQWSALGLLLGGMAVILSAMLNGFHLHGRLHPVHHLIRFALSLMIALPLAFWG